MMDPDDGSLSNTTKILTTPYRVASFPGSPTCEQKPAFSVL